MGNLSLIQILISFFLITLIFGDLPKIKKYINNFFKVSKKKKPKKQEKRELNPCPLVLETTVLPTELFSYYNYINDTELL